MAKDRICNDCRYYKNGWCKARKTNKGLGDLLECDFKKSNKIDPRKEETLMELLKLVNKKEDEFWNNFYDDESEDSDLLDEAMHIMGLQKGIIQNLMAKIKLLL